MEQIIRLYDNILLPVIQRVDTTTRKHKAKTITAAVALTTLIYITQKILRPPKVLRQVPHIGFFEYVAASISKKTTKEDIARLYTLPAALKTDEGIFVVSITRMLYISETILINQILRI